MSRIRNGITVTAGAAAGLFLATLASSATATADTAIPVNPGLPGVVEQMLASSASIPQQLLQTTASALTGAPPAPAPIATATLNMPQTPAALAPGAGPAAGAPGNLASVLPFPLPNFGGTTTTAAAPGALLPSVPAAAPVQPALAPGLLIPGLP